MTWLDRLREVTRTRDALPGARRNLITNEARAIVELHDLVLAQEDQIRELNDQYKRLEDRVYDLEPS